MPITNVKQQESGKRVTWDDGRVSFVPPGHRFNADIDEWVAAGNTVEPEVTDAEYQAALPDRIAARRYEAETAGITVGGISFNTDRQSQSLITGAALSATRNPDYTVHWKTQDGPVTLDADQLGAAADAVRDHVQACFDREFELLDAVADGSFDESMLDQGWPKSHRRNNHA